jgi:hypothetical protein
MESNPLFKKLIEKKKKEGKTASPMQSKAKGSVLSDLVNELGGMGLEKIKGLKQKVTVAADSRDDLAKGLDKAKEMVAHSEHPEESEEEESEESPAEEMAEEDSEEPSEDDESEEDLKAKIAELEAKLAKKKA